MYRSHVTYNSVNSELLADFSFPFDASRSFESVFNELRYFTNHARPTLSYPILVCGAGYFEKLIMFLAPFQAARSRSPPTSIATNPRKNPHPSWRRRSIRHKLPLRPEVFLRPKTLVGV